MCRINTVKLVFSKEKHDLILLFFSAICASIRKAAKISRFPEPQVLPASMQEISIKKELANDMKKSVNHYIESIDFL